MKRQKQTYLVTASELANIFAVEPSTITNWKAEGMPVAVISDNQKEIRYCPADCIDWRFNKSKSKTTYDFNEERARLTKLQGDKIELDLKERHGELVPANEIETIWAGILTSIKTRFLALPKTFAQLFNGIENEFEMEQELETQIRNILEDLSSDQSK
jgi:phage terminase Nu1 subunit (DNA packaging protein)